MRGHLTAFLDQLERIGEEHDEVYDTDLRERMAVVIERTLVHGGQSIDVPRSLGIFSDEGNARVQAALATCLGSALPLATELRLDEAARRGAVWDGWWWVELRDDGGRVPRLAALEPKRT